jgi:hypothetical protein
MVLLVLGMKNENLSIIAGMGGFWTGQSRFGSSPGPPQPLKTGEGVVRDWLRRRPIWVELPSGEI